MMLVDMGIDGLINEDLSQIPSLSAVFGGLRPGTILNAFNGDILIENDGIGAGSIIEVSSGGVTVNCSIVNPCKISATTVSLKEVPKAAVDITAQQVLIQGFNIPQTLIDQFRLPPAGRSALRP